MLIAFEGGEGSGKGTQIRLLEQSLKSRGIDVLSVIEPGETAVGKAIRKILLDRKNLRILGITEALLFFAARPGYTNHKTRARKRYGRSF